MDLTAVAAFFDARFATGQAINAVLAVTLTQTLVFAFLAKNWRARVNVFFAAAPGLVLIMAVREAVVGAPWWAIAFWLALAWPLHLFDLARRPP